MAKTPKNGKVKRYGKPFWLDDNQKRSSFLKENGFLFHFTPYQIEQMMHLLGESFHSLFQPIAKHVAGAYSDIWYDHCAGPPVTRKIDKPKFERWLKAFEELYEEWFVSVFDLPYSSDAPGNKEHYLEYMEIMELRSIETPIALEDIIQILRSDLSRMRHPGRMKKRWLQSLTNDVARTLAEEGFKVTGYESGTLGRLMYILSECFGRHSFPVEMRPYLREAKASIVVRGGNPRLKN